MPEEAELVGTALRKLADSWYLAHMVDIESKARPKDESPQWRRILLMESIIIALLSVSFFAVSLALTKNIPAANLPDLGGLATLFFGVSGVGLVLLSLFVGGIAVFGWQSLKEDIRAKVEASTRERIDYIGRESRGLMLAAIGFMIGAQHSKPDVLEQSEKDKDYLSESVYYCRQAYKILKDMEGTARYMALNNLIYYSCLHGEAEKSDYLLEQAKTLKSVGQEYNFPEFQLTYCRAILQYGDGATFPDAHQIAKALLKGPLSDRQKKEATFYVTSLAAKSAAKTVN